MAGRAQAAQYLGTRRSCRVLEVCGVAPVDGQASRVVSIHGIKLVSASARCEQARLASGYRPAGSDASGVARGCVESPGERIVASAEGQHCEQRRSPLGSGSSRPLPCGSNSTVEKAVIASVTILGRWLTSKWRPTRQMVPCESCRRGARLIRHVRRMQRGNCLQTTEGRR